VSWLRTGTRLKADDRAWVEKGVSSSGSFLFSPFPGRGTRATLSYIFQPSLKLGGDRSRPRWRRAGDFARVKVPPVLVPGFAGNARRVCVFVVLRAGDRGPIWSLFPGMERSISNHRFGQPGMLIWTLEEEEADTSSKRWRWNCRRLSLNKNNNGGGFFFFFVFLKRERCRRSSISTASRRSSASLLRGSDQHSG